MENRIPTKKELIVKLNETNAKLEKIQDRMDVLMEQIQDVFNDFSNTLRPVINDYYEITEPKATTSPVDDSLHRTKTGEN